LEELDGVARRIFQKNLLATEAGNDLITKVDADALERGASRIQIIHFELNPVPPPGSGRRPSGIACAAPTVPRVALRNGGDPSRGGRN
jgi:hypothetical protein